VRLGWRGHTAHRTIVVAVVLALIGGLFAGSARATAQDEPVTLSFVGPETPEAMEPVIAAFQAANPSITVEYESVPFAQLNDILQTRLGSGDATPDVYTADQPRISALVSRGFLLDITDDIGDISDRVLPSAIEASSVEGRLYALPVSTSTQLLYYNQDLLAAANLTPPSMGTRSSASPGSKWRWTRRPPKTPAPCGGSCSIRSAASIKSSRSPSRSVAGTA